MGEVGKRPTPPVTHGPLGDSHGLVKYMTGASGLRRKACDDGRPKHGWSGVVNEKVYCVCYRIDDTHTHQSRSARNVDVRSGAR